MSYEQELYRVIEYSGRETGKLRDRIRELEYELTESRETVRRQGEEILSQLSLLQKQGSEIISWQGRAEAAVAERDDLRITEDKLRMYLRLARESRRRWRAKATAVDTRLFSLEWIGAPRPPVHPNAMTGRQGFPTFAKAVAFMENQPTDARFVSLTEHITRSVDRTADVLSAMGQCHERP